MTTSHNLFKNQTLRIRQNELEEIEKISKGIKYECVCSIIVFNKYIGEVTKEIKM